MDVLRYDNRIDNAILRILCTKSKCSYLQLKRLVDRIFSKERLSHGLNPSISFETYNSHLKNLIDWNKVRRHKPGIEASSKVFYSVTKAVNCYKYKEMSDLDILKD
jgi:hypothetical protein